MNVLKETLIVHSKFSSRRRVLRAGASAALLAAAGQRALAAEPLDTIKIVSGFPPGSTSDICCRKVVERLPSLGSAKVALVENRTGAGGQLAVQYVATQPADGRTLLQTPMSMLGIYPHTYNKLPYDPVKDLVPVTQACAFDFALAVGPAVPDSVGTVADLLQWMKADALRATFGGPAAGATPHFAGVLLGRAANVDLTHIAYRGTQPALLDVVGGQIAAAIGPVGDVIKFIGQPKYRILATTGAARSRFASDVPTLVEQGYKDLVFDEWYGFFLPRGATPDLVQRMNQALREAVEHPETEKGYSLVGMQARTSSPEELAALLRRDTARWGPIVKSIGFTAST